MTEVEYKDPTGRKFRVLVPEGCPEGDYGKGIIVGPPDLDSRLENMGWPEALRVTFHNQLYDRKLFTFKDVMKAHPTTLDGAIKATFKISMNLIPQWYREEQGG